MTEKNNNGIVLSAELGRESNIALMTGGTSQIFKKLAEYFLQNNLKIPKEVLDDYRAKGLVA
jgi:hypothetical protein